MGTEQVAMIPLALVAAAFLLQEPPAPVPRTASVRGKVVNAMNGEAVAKATVILHAVDAVRGISFAEETDSAGRFHVDDVEPGEYIITADHPRFFFRTQGASGAPLSHTRIESGQQLQDVVVPLTPLGVISGRVTDQDGDPVRASVQAMVYRYQNEKKQLTTARMVQCNTRGDFQLFGLRPGTYYLQVTKRNVTPGAMQGNIRGAAPATGFTTTFYPSATDAAHAVPIHLEPGAQIRGIDVIARPGGTHSIRYKLSEDVRTFSGLSPMIMSAEGDPTFVPSSLRVSEGGLEFYGVAPGSYIVLIERKDANQTTYARQEVQMANEDIDGGTLSFVPPLVVSGTARIESATPRSAQTVRLTLAPIFTLWSPPVETQVQPDGSFMFRDLPPNIYRLATAQGPSDLYIKSIRIADQPLTSRQFDLTRGAVDSISIVLAADVGVIEGFAKHADGEPAVRVRVTAIPYGDRLGHSEFSRFAFTSDKGHFSIRNVAPGEYQVFAWEDVEIGAPQDPDFRKPFEKMSVAVKLAPNGRETIECTAIVTKSGDQ
jgi:carboxypeptidase family protein